MNGDENGANIASEDRVALHWDMREELVCFHIRWPGTR